MKKQKKITAFVLDMQLLHMTAVGDRLLLTHQEGFTIYDPATGKQTEEAVLSDFLEKNFKNKDLLGNTGVYPLLVTGAMKKIEQSDYRFCRERSWR